MKLVENATLCVTAFRALQSADVLKLEGVLDQVLLAGGLQLLLNALEEYVEELRAILLLANVCWAAIELLVCVANRSSVHCGPLRKFKSAKQTLELEQQVVLVLCFSPFLDLDVGLVNLGLKEQIPELGYHVALLQDRNHVANAAEVRDT